MEDCLIFIALAPLLIVMFVAFIILRFRTRPGDLIVKRENELKPVVYKIIRTMEEEYELLKSKGLL